MLIFAAVLFLFALMVFKGETGLIRTFRFTAVRNKKEYAGFLGKTLALVALTMAAAGAVCYFINTVTGLITFTVLFILEMVMIGKRSKKYYK